MTDSMRQDVLQALGELSVEFPQWRLGQMIANLAVVARGANVEAIWDVEDQELLEAIRSQLEKRSVPSLNACMTTRCGGPARKPLCVVFRPPEASLPVQWPVNPRIMIRW